MTFFTDVAEVSELRTLAAVGLLDGVARNRSVITKSRRTHLEFGASTRSANHVGKPVRAGADAVPAPAALQQGLFMHPQTDAVPARCMADWAAAQA